MARQRAPATSAVSGEDREMRAGTCTALLQMCEPRPCDWFPLRAQQLRISVLVLVCLHGPSAADSGRGCDVAAYYAPADLEVSGAELAMQLHSLVATPHTVIPYTHATKTDTWDALRDLDADPADPSKVILIYSQRAEPADSQGVASGWNREHVWPKSFGVRCCPFPLLRVP